MSEAPATRKATFLPLGGLLRDLVAAATKSLKLEETTTWFAGDYFPDQQWIALSDAETLLGAPLTFQTLVSAKERPGFPALLEDHALLRIAGYRSCPAALWEVHCWDSDRWILVGPDNMSLEGEPQRALGPFDYWIDAEGNAWYNNGEFLSLPEARRLMADYWARGQDWEYALTQLDSPHPPVRQLAAAVLGWSNHGEVCRRMLTDLRASDPDLGVRETAGISL